MEGTDESTELWRHPSNFFLTSQRRAQNTIMLPPDHNEVPLNEVKFKAFEIAGRDKRSNTSNLQPQLQL